MSAPLPGTIDPLMLSVVTKPDLDDAAVRRIAIRNGEEPVADQTQAKDEVDVTENRLWRAVSLEWFQVNVIQSLFTETIYENYKTLFAGE